MRSTCLLCVRKHLGKAEALMNEVVQGYPHHAGLAIGNLSEAADECFEDYPELAAEIRRHWKAWELDEMGYSVPTTALLRMVEERLQSVRDEQNRFHASHEPGSRNDDASEAPTGAETGRERFARLVKQEAEKAVAAGDPSAVAAARALDEDLPPRAPRPSVSKVRPPTSE